MAFDSSRPAIVVDDLGKRYRIGRLQPHRTSFREAATRALTAPLRRLARLGQPPGADETLWALRHVSFEVAPGEVMGVVGPNGAGKSTLLKVLARVTPPTEGRAELRGRLASLLEVGTGFHYELTGRENIYLSGAILGMKRVEIRQRFDEIVAFAEVERFLDTPVKRYSSGMYVRLAFAVAAHLEPEILLVDEVLAVGDEAFRRKCLGKMRDASRGGRTVLLVSHNMGAIRSLCPRALLMSGGQVARIGPAGEVVDHYLATAGPSQPLRTWEAPVEVADTEQTPASPLELKLLDAAGAPAKVCASDRGFGFALTMRVHAPTRFVARLKVHAQDGTPLFTLSRDLPAGDTEESGQLEESDQLSPGVHRVTAHVAAPRLRAGVHFASLTLERTRWGKFFHEEKAIEWTVAAAVDGEQRTGDEPGGYVHADAAWEVRPLDQLDQ